MRVQMMMIIRQGLHQFARVTEIQCLADNSLMTYTSMKMLESYPNDDVNIVKKTAPLKKLIFDAQNMKFVIDNQERLEFEA